MKGVVEHLFDLIRIPSVSTVSNRPIIEYAQRVLEGASWFTSRTSYIDPNGVEKFNLVAAPPGHTTIAPSPYLAFVCHTDTVPFDAEWARALDPFAEHDLIHGCGACDVKGFLACLLYAIQESSPAKINPDLCVVLTADEEVGCIGASKLVTATELRPRRVIVGEPTGLHPARAGKGYCLAKVTVVGREAHSAHPDQGLSSIYAAARLISAIESLAAEFAHETNNFFAPPMTTFNIGTIAGGTAKNIVPGLCSFDLEWRPLPGIDSLKTLIRIQKTAHEVEDAHPGIRCEIKPLRMQSGFESVANSTLVHAIESCSGRRATSIPFGSEASIFSSTADEVVVFGPGDMRTAHSSRECVPIGELEEAVACMKSLMCG